MARSHDFISFGEGESRQFSQAKSAPEVTDRVATY